jgi:hypothetical protein
MIDWRLHRVTYSEVDDNGFVGIQFDGFGEERSGIPAIEVHHPFGLMANPPEPDPNGEFSCDVLIGYDGDQPHAWLYSDPRSRVVLPIIKRGETLLYGFAGNMVRMHDDGRISIFTTDDATPNGKTIALQIMPTGLLFSAPWGKITFDATGFHVLHSSGAAIDLGAIGGLPAPLNAISSYVKLTACSAQTEATIIANGTTAGTTEPVAKATTLLTVLGTLSTALAKVNAAFVALGGITAGAPNSGAAAQIGDATTAIATAAAAVSAAGITLPSTSSGVT